MLCFLFFLKHLTKLFSYAAQPLNEAVLNRRCYSDFVKEKLLEAIDNLASDSSQYVRKVIYTTNAIESLNST